MLASRERLNCCFKAIELHLSFVFCRHYFKPIMAADADAVAAGVSGEHFDFSCLC